MRMSYVNIIKKQQCHNCDEMSRMMTGMQTDLAKLQINVAAVETKVAKVDRNVAKWGNKVTNIETNMANMERKVAKIEMGMNEIGMNNIVEAKELKKTLTHVINDKCENVKETLLEKLERLEKKQEEIAIDVRHISSTSKEKQGIIVAGGLGESSVEIYNASKRSWSILQCMPGKRFQASSFVYKNHMNIAGGYCYGIAVNNLIQTNIHPQPNPSTEWKDVLAKLPNRLAGHSSVLFNDSLLVTGGWDEDEDAYSDCIHEVHLQPPYTVELAAKMPEAREGHCTELFNDNIFIIGGNQTGMFVKKQVSGKNQADKVNK